MFLLSGVSYYKTAAPPVIDFGETALTEAEEAFLREFYLQGLAEFAYRNHLDLGLSAARSQAGPGPALCPAAGAAPDRAGPWSRSAAGSTRS